MWHLSLGELSGVKQDIAVKQWCPDTYPSPAEPWARVYSTASCPPRWPDDLCLMDRVSSWTRRHPKAVSSPPWAVIEASVSWHLAAHVTQEIGRSRAVSSAVPWSAALSAAMPLFLLLSENSLLTRLVFSVLTTLVLLKLVVVKDQFFSFPSYRRLILKKYNKSIMANFCKSFPVLALKFCSCLI